MKLSPQQAHEMLQARPEMQIIDVRTAEEYEMFLIAGARNIDISLDDFEAQINTLNQDGAYLVHCHSGERSQKALAVFQRHGFKNVYHLEGGLREWAFQDLPHIYNHSL